MFDRKEKDIFGLFENQMKEMEKSLEHMIESDMFNINKINIHSGRPKVYGFSMYVGSDGIPHVREFSDMNIGMDISGTNPEFKEPFTSIMVKDKEGQIVITADMPGIEKKDIELNAAEDSITIKAEAGERKYHKVLPLEAAIDPDSATAKFNNGVLEVTFALKKAQKRGKSIKID